MFGKLGKIISFFTLTKSFWLTFYFYFVFFDFLIDQTSSVCGTFFAAKSFDF